MEVGSKFKEGGGRGGGGGASVYIYCAKKNFSVVQALRQTQWHGPVHQCMCEVLYTDGIILSLVA